MVWNVIRKYVPDQISSQIRVMRAFKDMMGACFDVPSDYAQRFEDIFKYEESERRCDFKMTKAKELPELKEDDRMMGGNTGGYGGNGYSGNTYSQSGRFQGGSYGNSSGGRGGYGGGRGDYGGSRGGYGGGSSYGGRGGY